MNGLDMKIDVLTLDITLDITLVVVVVVDG